jgi:hypothetical protein
MNRCSTLGMDWEFVVSKAPTQVMVLTQSPIGAEGAFSVGKATGA